MLFLPFRVHKHCRLYFVVSHKSCFPWWQDSRYYDVVQLYQKSISLEHQSTWKNKYSHCWEMGSSNGLWMDLSRSFNFDNAIRDSYSVQAAVCRNLEGWIIPSIFQIIILCDPGLLLLLWWLNWHPPWSWRSSLSKVILKVLFLCSSILIP